MTGFVTGMPRMLLRLEALSVVTGTLVAYASVGSGMVAVRGFAARARPFHAGVSGWQQGRGDRVQCGSLVRHAFGMYRRGRVRSDSVDACGGSDLDHSYRH